MSNQCATNLLPDEPTTRDVFGSHERVASAIAQLVSSETVGRAIAVTGPWGSGKSSVLRMVRERLTGAADVFVFDAWAHEGDPLRRTFLERLIDFLYRDEPDQEIEGLKRALLLRNTTQEITTTPVLSVEAKLIALGLLLVPVGLAIFSASFGKPEKTSYLYFGIALVLLPLAILVLSMLGAGLLAICSSSVSRFGGKRLALWSAAALSMVGAVALWQKGRLLELGKLFSSHRAIGLAAVALPIVITLIAILKWRANAPGGWSDVFPLLLNKTVTTSRSESVESVDPTSIEFQQSFAAIVKAHGGKKRRLVIAVDNLDRVDPSLALRLWATMQTFFEFDFETHPWASSVWLLAAFDIGALQRLWPVSSQDGEAGNGHAESFVNKTFQASFSVPPLILLNRDDYLLAQLTTAFPSHPESEFHGVIQLYGLKHLTEVCTPRAITNFVNSVGTLHRQWGDEIPLFQQALYAIASPGMSGVMRLLAAAPPFPEELIRPNWRDAIAAIHFNVPIARAAHVFMSGPLMASLARGDVSELLRLSGIVGFGRVLEDVVIRNREAWVQGDSQNLTIAIFAMNAAKLDKSDPGVSTAWEWLVNAASRLEKWAPVTDKTGVALSILIAGSGDEQQQARFLKLAGTSLPRANDGSIDSGPAALQNWVSNMGLVLEMLPGLPDSCELVVVGSALTYIGLLKALKNTLGAQFDQIAPRLSTEARDRIPVVLGEMIRNAKVDEDLPQFVKVFAQHQMKLDWTPVVDSVESIFGNVNNNMKQPFFGIALEAALLLSNSTPTAVAALEKLGAKGYLHHYLGSLGAVETRSGLVALLALLLFCKRDPTQWPGQATQGKFWYSNGELQGAAKDKSILRAVAQIAVETSQVQRLRSVRNGSETISKLIEMASQVGLGRIERVDP
jgi:hypothetical protein